MSKFRIVVSIFLFVALLLISFTLWYNYTYSMKVISGYEINTPNIRKSILIASQGSDYKNKIVDNLVSHYKQQDIYLKIIDVTELEKVNSYKFNAIVILHTWEMGHPPIEVYRFIAKNKCLKNNMAIVSTSGDGVSKMENIDAITGESIISNVSLTTKKIINKLKFIL